MFKPKIRDVNDNEEWRVTRLEMQIIKFFKECPQCGSRTEKLIADLHVCQNLDCSHIDATNLYELLKSRGATDQLLSQIQMLLLPKITEENNMEARVIVPDSTLVSPE
jgi:hypothetical protein